jgi:hypothetical protein
MAVNYNQGGTAEFHEVDTAVLTAPPITMSCFVNPDRDTEEEQAMFLGDLSVGDQYFALEVSGHIGGDPISAITRSGTIVSARSSTGFTIGTWHHACAVFAAVNDRKAYIDGGSEGTNGTTHTPTGVDRTSLGHAGDSSPSRRFDGQMCEAAIWAAALEIPEIEALAKGFCPLLIRPTALVFYAPMWRLIGTSDVQDIVGGLTLLNNGTPDDTEHFPGMLYPSSGRINSPGEVVVPQFTFKGGWEVLDQNAP